ncbi:MAG: hypothetical protein KatS3mg101_0945 [Patescibacteria group bacterium]|nr:MAG: hypothetical protein KatS3mg101_0945 [Patescibacteria group bacterium]
MADVRDIFPTPPITKMMYSWAKWGGGNFGLVKEYGEWFCQICGERQTPDSPSYMFPEDSFRVSFIRICPICKAEIEATQAQTLEELKGMLEDVKRKIVEKEIKAEIFIVNLKTKLKL